MIFSLVALYRKSVCFFILLTCPFSSFSETQITPIKIYAQSPIQSNSLSTELRSAFAMEENRVELFASGTIASVWAHSEDFNLDYYQNQLITGAQWQINSRFKAEIKYQYNYAGNNQLDSFVNGFHDLFGLGQNGRDEVEDDQFTASIPKYGVEVSDFENEILSSALHSYFEYQVFENKHNAVSLGASLHFNHVDSGPFKRSNFEQGVQVNYSFSYQKHALFSTLGVTFRDPDILEYDILYKTNTLAFAIGYGYAITPSHHIITSYHLYEGAIKGDEDYSQPSHEYVLGYRYLTGSAAFEFSAIENAVNMDNSTDIAFTFGVRYVL